MAVSRIEEKILGRLARQLPPSNALLSSSLFQVLGLSIQLSRRLYRARKLRKLDPTRDTKSLQLYHHIIWLAQEGLAITETRVLPYLRSTDYGPEYKVMAAKMQASLRHILCLFDSTPSTAGRSGDPSGRSHVPTADPNSQQSENNANLTNADGKRTADAARRRDGKAPLRDPIPSVTSDASYVTNPFAGTSQTPPPSAFIAFGGEPRRMTPSRPPGLTPGNVAANIAAASFLLNDEDKVPATKGYFNHAQHLAESLLSPTHALRLSVSLEHAAFLWDCAHDQDRARKLARRAIKEVYASTDGLDDDEFADASALVQALGGLVKRGSANVTPQPSRDPVVTPTQQSARKPPLAIDRTIAVSPMNIRNGTQSPGEVRAMMRTPERLSTVPEVESVDEQNSLPALGSPAYKSRLPQPRRSSPPASPAAASDKTAKRRIAEQAEELYRQNSFQSTSIASNSNQNNSAFSSVLLPSHNLPSSAATAAATSSRPHSRQATPPEGLPTKPKSPKSDTSSASRRRRRRQRTRSPAPATTITAAPSASSSRTTTTATTAPPRSALLPPLPKPTSPSSRPSRPSASASTAAVVASDTIASPTTPRRNRSRRNNNAPVAVGPEMPIPGAPIPRDERREAIRRTLVIMAMKRTAAAAASTAPAAAPAGTTTGTTTSTLSRASGQDGGEIAGSGEMQPRHQQNINDLLRATR